jgi:hypothetical protein
VFGELSVDFTIDFRTGLVSVQLGLDGIVG